MTSVTKGIENAVSAMRKRAQKAEAVGVNLACRVIASASTIEGKALSSILASVEARRSLKIDPETAISAATIRLIGESHARRQDVAQALEALRDLRAIRDDQLIVTIANAIDYYRNEAK